VAKILVADDNSNIQKMVGLALKDQGIDVVAVGNGEAAVRKISDIRPDLVLADVFMPVRNGYEVCRYVKEDSSLAHIPVILLVGAFDPLDEQEAQRVGADGVLKKPFVPPDPLISMVKSALTRAGIPIGPGSEKAAPPAAPKRSTTDILSGAVNPKLTSIAPERIPEASPEPVEEFPTAPPIPQLKIAAGNQPLAFGSLLDTSEGEDLAITSKPMIEIAKDHKWEEESDEVQEEKEEAEEEAPSWRPGGLNETLERAGAETPVMSPDWRDEAFHGAAPANNAPLQQWSLSDVPPSFAETVESQTVAVATAESKPAGESLPFTSDAWAAAMAAGVEEKVGEISEVQQTASVVQETQAAPEVQTQHSEPIVETPAPAPQAAVEETAPAVETPSVEPPSEPANWAPAPQTAWEAEAKKASQLASTWDAPKSYTPEETQEVQAYSSETSVEHAETPAVELVQHSAYSSEPAFVHGHEEKVGAPANGVPASSFEAAAPKSLENAWGAATSTPVVEHVKEEVRQETPQAPAVSEPVAATQPAQPDMDEIVARVLGKMNPDVLQKVTREILKPVIEAIVRDEMESKKS
jgi:CheY-like chemotaxis protein